MPLTIEEVNKLLSLPTRTRKSKSGPDTSVRDYQTWFKLAQKMIDDDNTLPECTNPNCPDKREYGAIVATVNGHDMCRLCFLAGWQL